MNGFVERNRPSNITNDLLWDEIRYIRKKLDLLESKVMIVFGTVSAFSVAVALYEVLGR